MTRTPQMKTIALYTMTVPTSHPARSLNLLSFFLWVMCQTWMVYSGSPFPATHCPCAQRTPLTYMVTPLCKRTAGRSYWQTRAFAFQALQALLRWFCRIINCTLYCVRGWSRAAHSEATRNQPLSHLISSPGYVLCVVKLWGSRLIPRRLCKRQCRSKQHWNPIIFQNWV